MKKVALLVGLAAAIGYNNAEAVDWNWKGDIRYRYESTFKDNESKDDDHSRDRHRMRVRFGVYPWITEELSAGLQLSTGGSETTSRNETFDDSFLADGIYLNEAFVDYHPMFLNGDVNVILGKRDVAKTLIVMKDLLWDSDITLEGATLQYGKDADGKEKDGVNAVLGYYAVNENNGDDKAAPDYREVDGYIVSAQLAYTGEVSDLRYKIGAGYYDLVNLDVKRSDDPDLGSKPDFNYEGKDFNIVELFASVGGSITETVPWKVYGQYAFNTASNDATRSDRYNIDDDKRDAYLIGLQIGGAKNPGEWAVSGEYVTIEKDAVTFLTDSDRNGGSSTDLEGFKLNATYHLVQNMTLGATYMNFSKIDDDSVTNHLLQADVVVKF
ncbi:MAG: putative porin [Chlorobium sp.]|uniref:putative porin n=1 Tax=Chlorobium sp. TaxID=1095 RepID=UPI002F404B5F